jgi:hypothetical protein
MVGCNGKLQEVNEIHSGKVVRTYWICVVCGKQYLTKPDTKE